MKKILFLSTLESTPWGGSEQLWSDMTLRLLEKKYSVMVNTIEWPTTQKKLLQIQEKGGELVFRPNVHIQSSIKGRVLNKVSGQKWKGRIQEFKPDVVLINQGGTFDNALYPTLASWIKSLNAPYYIIPNFCPEYGYLADNLRPFFAEYFSGAEKVLFVSKRNLEVAERLLARAIPNGIVIKNPIKLTETPINYPSEDIYKMAAVARLETEVKGYDLLIEVLGQPQWKDRNFQVNIYGQGEHKKYLEELIAFRGLQDKIIFRGFLNNVEQVWEENHILVMPSRGEGTPLSLLEANYCGRAAIVTDVGGNADVITEGENGFVAEAPVIGSFSHAMDRAWQKRQQWKAMGENAKQKLQQSYPKDPVREVIKLILGKG
ncbi:MAG TPA: glycosyltransferase family 4 protein [Flavipsychrobacter sp.]|nr:glycosyltransferase family 4 protein [Flavipsychrobacter sp.]